jgi:hypothetical protein
MYGQMGGQQEMAAHGLSGDAAPVSGLPSLSRDGLGGAQSPPNIQSLLDNGSMDWGNLMGPLSFLSKWAMQQPQDAQDTPQQPLSMHGMLQQAQQYMQQGLQGSQSSTSPHSVFSAMSMMPWQQLPGQA